MTWQNTVFDYLHHTIDSTAMCILAVSGGVDSMALLHLMHHYAPHRIIAATVDHGLRLSSFDEAHQVQQWCAALGVPHVILHWKGKKPNTGIQRQARDARYDALLELCLEKGAPYLMTAHHKDDQIETFFLRLFKGSGTKGLGAMKMHTVIQHNNRPHITLLRPLLDIAKKDLLAYLKEIGQDFITDPSNENKAFERVKLRHMISNLRHQNFDVDAIMETVDHCQQQSSFIDNIIEKHKAECFQENTLDIQKFLALESFLQKTLLREYLWHLSGKDYPPKFHAINNAIELLRAGKTFTRAGYVFKRSTDHYVMIKENR